ncbi:MAG: glycosyltransferase family 4 protein [Thermodesulfobacteriota bacterium]
MSSPKPSIMMLNGRWRPLGSGAELQAERLAAKLVELGFPVQVFTQHLDPSSPTEEVYRGIRINRVDFPLAYDLNRSAAPTLRYLVERRRTFDILHDHQMLGHAAVSTIAARWLGKRNVIKVSLTGTDGDLTRFCRIKYARWGMHILHMADAVIAVSREINFELLQHGFAPEKIRRLPNGVDVQEFSRRAPFPGTSPPRFILLGRRNPQKGIDTVLQALKIMAEKGSIADGLEVDFYGWDYPEWDYRQMSRDLGVERYVRFLPFEKNVVEVYQKAYGLLLPSTGEGLSNVLLEAMAMELPAIGSRVSGTEEVLDHRQNGLLIPPGSPEALAEAMEQLLADPGWAARLGRQARRQVEKHYSLDAVAQQYAQLYERLWHKQEFL